MHSYSLTGSIMIFSFFFCLLFSFVIAWEAELIISCFQILSKWRVRYFGTLIIKLLRYWETHILHDPKQVVSIHHVYIFAPMYFDKQKIKKTQLHTYTRVSTGLYAFVRECNVSTWNNKILFSRIGTQTRLYISNRSKVWNGVFGWKTVNKYLYCVH